MAQGESDLTPPAAPRGLFVGLATLDLISRVPRLPHPDEKMAPSEQLLVAGGPATNAAVTFSELGGQARLATVLGRHHITGLAREELATHRVDVLDLNHDPTLHLPLVTVLVQESSGQRAAISPGARHLRDVDPVPPEALDACDVLLVDGHLIDASIDAARAARDRGVPVVLDGGSWKPRLDELLPFIDHAICSEVFRPPGTTTTEEAFAAMADRPIPEVAVTRGAQPILYRGSDGPIEIAVPRIEAVDTLGAGDVFHGAYTYFLARGLAAREALRRASEIAALSCRFFGPRRWIEHLGEAPD